MPTGEVSDVDEAPETPLDWPATVVPLEAPERYF